MSTEILNVVSRDIADYAYGVKEMIYAIGECYAEAFMTLDEMHDGDDAEIQRQLGRGMIEETNF